METNELRTALKGHLDTLKRNLAVVSREELSTKYKKPYEELLHNIRSTATAYAKQTSLGHLRIRADLLDEALPLVQAAIDQSGLLHQLSAAAFQKQDIAEFDRLALMLRAQIDQALVPFFRQHLCLYREKDCPSKPPEYYNAATGCVWRNRVWTPIKLSSTAVLLPVQDSPKATA